MTLTARRLRREGPDQWVATLTLDKGARNIELGPYKTLGRAMLTGLHVYHEWTMPLGFGGSIRICSKIRRMSDETGLNRA